MIKDIVFVLSVFGIGSLITLIGLYISFKKADKDN